MGITSALYRIVLLVHIAATIVGFGGLLTHGAYNAKAFRAPAAVARTLLETTASVARIAHYSLYALFLLGIVLISVSDGAFGFGDGWVSASFLVWFVMIGLIHGVVRPSVNKLAARAGELADDERLDADQAGQAIARRLALGDTGVNLLLIVALVLMIWQPGT